MPAQMSVSPAETKRKSPVSGHSPAVRSKAKRRLTKDSSTSSGDPTPVATDGLSRRATKFIVGLASQLFSARVDADGETGPVDIDVHGAGRAAINALPEGKLKAELSANEAATIKALSAEVASLRPTSTPEDGENKQPERQRGEEEERGGTSFTTASDAVGGIGAVALSTTGLHRRASQDANDVEPLKALALNPRAPLEVLIDAVGTAAADIDDNESTSAIPSVESAVARLRNLATAVAADPAAVVSSPMGAAFYANRAASLASSAAKALATARESNSGGDIEGSKGVSMVSSQGEDALGLMLRLLQVVALAPSAAACGGGLVTGVGTADNSGVSRAGGNSNDDHEGAHVAFKELDPADRLLLPISRETSPSLSSRSDALVADAVTTTTTPPLPPARLSAARLLAHYATASAVCCCIPVSRSGRAGLVAGAVIESARAAAFGWAGGGDADEGTGSSSSSSDDDDDEDDGKCSPDGRSNRTVLSRHLSTMCAAHLAGNEHATLEFLRCVGDFFFVFSPSSPSSGKEGSTSSITPAAENAARRASLATTCARALGRLPRSSALSHPTASQFLKRAYCYRVVTALNESAASSVSLPSSLSKRRGAVPAAAAATISGRRRSALPSSTHSRSGVGGVESSWNSSTSPSWDFLGAATTSIPRSLLDFLGRPEAPAAVGEGPAGIALTELVSRRHSPTAVAELLRSSPACAPAILGPLLAAVEQLETDGNKIGDGVGSSGGGVIGVKREEVFGGFFIDTGGVRSGSGETVLAPFEGGSTGGAGMDEDEEAHSVASSASTDRDG